MIKQIIKKLFLNKVFTVFNGTLKGVKLRLTNELKGTFLFKNYEYEKQLVFTLLIQPQDVFFDVGANIGLHSYYVQKNIKDVNIIAFEPLQNNVTYIKETIANNKFTNIKVENTALGNQLGTIYFDVQHNNSVGNITTTNTGIEVNITTLDKYTNDNNIYPNVLKIDVEGAEGDVLNGGKYFIEKIQPILIIELHSPAQDLLVAQFLTDRGYQIYRLNEGQITATNKLLQIIKKPNASWPDMDGVYGSIVGIPTHKMNDSIKSNIS